MASDHDDGGCPGTKRDVLELGPDLGDGHHPYVRHRPNCTLETGIIKAKQPGNDEAAPRCDGIVRLSHIGPGQVYTVETLYERSRPPTDVAAAQHSGPAMVASDDYRNGWDRIFGSPKPIGQA